MTAGFLLLLIAAAYLVIYHKEVIELFSVLAALAVVARLHRQIMRDLKRDVKKVS